MYTMLAVILRLLVIISVLIFIVLACTTDLYFIDIVDGVVKFNWLVIL